MNERAQKVIEAYETTYTESGLVAALREVINQLQQSPGVIMCADVLELCEELEKL